MTRNPVGDREDFSATYWSAILNGLAKEAVVSGCSPSKGSGDFDIDIASGEVVVSGTQASVSSGTVTLSTSDSNDRVDLVHADSSGTLSSTEGSASSTPTAPDIPSDEILLATVLVEGGASDLSSAGSSINDYRTIYVGGRAAKTVSSATTTSDEEVIGVDTSSSAITITLASADAYLGKEIVIFDTGDNASSNNITVDTESSETIDPGGASSKTITVDGGFMRLYSDGTNWYAEGRAIDAETISTDSIVSPEIGRRTTEISDSSPPTELTLPDAEVVEIQLDRTQAVNNGDSLELEFSKDGGSTYITASDYEYNHEAEGAGGTDRSSNATGQSSLELCPNLQNSQSRANNYFNIRIPKPQDGSPRPYVAWTGAFQDQSGEIFRIHGGGQIDQTIGVDALRLTSDGSLDEVRGRTIVYPGDS